MPTENVEMTETSPAVSAALPAPPPKRTRGFASMDQSHLRQISSLGGRTAHARGHAHKFSSAEASAGGRKGGRAVSQDPAHMSAIGRRGGLARRREQIAAAAERAADDAASAVAEPAEPDLGAGPEPAAALAPSEPGA